MATVVEYILNLRDNLSANVDKANNSVNKLESNLGNAKSAAMGLGSALGITFGVAGVGMFIKSMIDAGSKVENAKTGLTTLLKDANEAQTVIDNTMTDATKTPFAFEGLLSANKALISAGVESKRAREDVLNLGNAIAATGGGDNELQRMVVNLQQISNTGKATALDIKQFAFAGVNIYKVLEAAGIKANEKGKDSVITYDQITMALKKAHEAGGIYAGGLENMAGNTSVQISNLGDAIFQLKEKMFRDLKPAIESAISGLFKFIESLRKAWEWITKHKETVKGLAETFVVLWGVLKIGIPLMEGFGVATLGVLGPVGLLLASVANLVLAYDHLADAEKNLHDTRITLANDAAVKEQQSEQETIDKLVATGRDRKAAYDFITKSRTEYIKANLAALKEPVKRDIGGEDFEEQMKDYQFKKNLWQSKLDAVGKTDLIPKTKTLGTATKTNTGIAKVDTKSKAVGHKSITINVSIKDLIGTQNINTTNLKEGAGKIKEMVVSALTGAVNDFQVVAGS